jgi:hypothetical protein
MNEIEKKFRNITRPEHRCSYSCSCPSVHISEDGTELEIVGTRLEHPDYNEARIRISADLVRSALEGLQPK